MAGLWLLSSQAFVEVGHVEYISRLLIFLTVFLIPFSEKNPFFQHIFLQNIKNYCYL